MKPVIAVTPEAMTVPKTGAFCGAGYCRAVELGGGVPVILPLTANKSVLDQLIRRCDGLLLSGVGDIHPRFYAPRMTAVERRKCREVDEVRDVMEIFLTRVALRRRMPVLGICRGIQVMNVALGGTLLADVPGHAHKVAMARIQRVEWLPGSAMGKVLGVAGNRVTSTHHQALGRVAPGLRVVAWAEDGVVEAVEHVSARYFWGVQFHPERMVQVPAFRRLFRAFVRASSASARRGSAGVGES